MSESPYYLLSKTESLDQSSTSDEFLDNAGQSSGQVFVKVTIFFSFFFFFFPFLFSVILFLMFLIHLGFGLKKS